MKQILFLIVFLVFVSSLVLGQQKYTISGIVEDSKTGESVLYANVYEINTLIGTATNFYGFYSLTLKEGPVKVAVSYVGYATKILEFTLQKDTVINLSIVPDVEIEEVTVVAKDKLSEVQNNQMGMIKLPMAQVKQLPVLMGEMDILKSIQMMPGVQSGTEGTSGLYVRGGGPDQNLILLDGVPVYNANHLFGFLSVFNADAIQNVTLIKGGFPSRYGGRLSSVVDIKMKEGNSKEFKGEGSVGLVASKLTLEGPIVKDKTSFIVSGRRTYIDLLTKPIMNAKNKKQGDEPKESSGYYFYDINAKVNHKISHNSRIYLSAYLGKDRTYMEMDYKSSEDTVFQVSSDEADLFWGNITTALRWNYIFNPKLFANFTGTYSRYRFSISEAYYEEKVWPSFNNIEEYTFEYFSGITDYSAKVDFDYIPGSGQYIRFGGNFIHHTFHPGISVFHMENSQVNEPTVVDKTFGNKDIYSTEFAMYAEDNIKVTDKLQVNLGIRFSNYRVNKERYYYLEPRFSSRYLLNEKFSVKASYARMAQYIHLLTNSTIGLPTDLWVPATKGIKPQYSGQVAIGGVYNYQNNFEFSVEAYYKKMDNLIEYEEGASFFNAQNDWENKLESGQGWAKGIEVFIQKRTGKLTGWVGYTLSKTNRQFGKISFGQKFPYKFDRRHDISVVSTYKINDKIDFGASWIYGTGIATTLAEEKYVSPLPQFYNYQNNNNTSSDDYAFQTVEMIEHYAHRNAYRMPSYHRLDVGVNFRKKKHWGERTWSVGTYNTYNRQNPFYLYIDDNVDVDAGETSKVIKQVSLFPIIPYVRYSFKF
jgi:outer membrane receptor for ferrienterochelin and colicin